MVASNAYRTTSTENPLKHEHFDVVKPKAAEFWKRHKLGNIVDEDEFVKGALIFKDVRGARQFEYEHGPSPKFTAAQRARFSERQRFLSELSPRQNTSLRWYARRTSHSKEHEDDAVAIKHVFFDVGDVLVNAFKKEKPTRAEDKILWDHVKTFSAAQWQIFCTYCLAAMKQGWDQSAMNGANIAWPAKEQLDVDIGTTFGINVFGWLNAAPFFVGAILGSLLTDPLINAGLGRRWAIALGGFCSLIPVICTLFVTDWFGFMWCRIALGVGMGAKASVVPIYIAEIAPDTIRGRMSMCWQLFDTFGILTGSIANYIIYCYTEENPSWRIMISVSGVPALMFLILILFCVESPRWLMKKNRYREALTALIALHDLPSPVIACGELYMIFRRLQAEETKYLGESQEQRTSNKGKARAENGEFEMEDFNLVNTPRLKDQQSTSQHSHTQMDDNDSINAEQSHSGLGALRRVEESAGPSKAGKIPAAERPEIAKANEVSREPDNDAPVKLRVTSLLTRIKLLWHVRHIRHALRASQFVMAAQQACGINILAFMSTIMFAKAMSGDGNLIHLTAPEKESSLKFSIYFSIVNHFSTLIPLAFIDRAGRRTLLKCTFPLMALFLILAGVGLFIRGSDPVAGPRMFYGFTIIFTFFFSVGEGPAAFVISSEVFPLMVRELGMRLAVFTNFFLASVLCFCIPHGLTKAANTGGFWIAFGGMNLLLWFMSLLFVYETHGAPLEGINKMYNKSWKEGSSLGRGISELGAKIRKK